MKKITIILIAMMSLIGHAQELKINSGTELSIFNDTQFYVTGSSDGTAIYFRNLPTTNWYLISSPLSGDTVDNVRVNNNLSFSSSTGNLGFAFYDESLANPTWTYFTNASTDPLVNGLGYSIKVKNSSTEPQKVIRFEGSVNTADVLINITNSGTKANNGANLLGNPFNFPINVADILSDVDNATHLRNLAIQVWKASDNSYEVKNFTTPNFVLAPSQAFFLYANTDVGTKTITLKKSFKEDTSNSFQKSESPTIIDLLLTDGTNNRYAKLYYSSITTKGYDNGYDGESFKAFRSENPLDVFTHLVADNEGNNYQIQALPISDINTLVIPVGLKAPAGKELTFSVETTNLPTDTQVYLEDRLNKTFTRLDEVNATYKVTLTESMDGIGRFYLRSNASLSNDDFVKEEVNVYKIQNSSTLRVVGLSQGQGKSSVKLYNILGKNVFETSFNAANVNDINLPKLATGVYVVKLDAENTSINKKIIIE